MKVEELMSAISSGQALKDPMRFMVNLTHFQAQLTTTNAKYKKKVDACRAGADDHSEAVSALIKESGYETKEFGDENACQLYAFFSVLQLRYFQELKIHQNAIESGGKDFNEANMPPSYHEQKALLARLGKALSMASALITFFSDKVDSISTSVYQEYKKIQKSKKAIVISPSILQKVNNLFQALGVNQRDHRGDYAELSLACSSYIKPAPKRHTMRNSLLAVGVGLFSAVACITYAYCQLQDEEHAGNKTVSY